MELFLFSLTAGNDDRGSAENQDSANDVEDRGTDATGGGIITAKKTDNNVFFEASLEDVGKLLRTNL